MRGKEEEVARGCGEQGKARKSANNFDSLTNESDATRRGEGRGSGADCGSVLKKFCAPIKEGAGRARVGAIN